MCAYKPDFTAFIMAVFLNKHAGGIMWLII